MFCIVGQSRSGSVVTAEDPSQGGYSPERGKSFDTTRSLPPILPESPLLSAHSSMKGWNSSPTHRDVDTNRGTAMNTTATVLASFRQHDATPVSLRSLTRSPPADNLASPSTPCPTPHNPS